jgi:cyclopropane fatty-acyl-phospholipid synthase-like methyltransferase
MLPFSAAADRNKDVILGKLEPILKDRRRVLEIGSSNGQHAVHVTNAVPHIIWQCSDLSGNLPGISERLDQDGNSRTLPPLALDVAESPWPLPAPGADDAFDIIFTANTLHIMSFVHVEQFFARAGEVLSNRNGVLCVYGPLKYGGEFTTASNAAFDLQLKGWDPVSGIRDFEALNGLAEKAGLTFTADYAMPANNQLVVWERS